MPVENLPVVRITDPESKLSGRLGVWVYATDLEACAVVVLPEGTSLSEVWYPQAQLDPAANPVSFTNTQLEFLGR